MGGGSRDRVARGLPTGGQGSKVYVLCAEPKEHKHFRPGIRPGGSGTRPGGSVTGVTKKSFMCQMFMCLFRPLILFLDAPPFLPQQKPEMGRSVPDPKYQENVCSSNATGEQHAFHCACMTLNNCL